MVQPAKGLRLHSAGERRGYVFVHISAVERAGLTTLNDGQKVSFETVAGRQGKPSAIKLKVG
jgi:cold shock CspA family protein